MESDIHADQNFYARRRPEAPHQPRTPTSTRSPDQQPLRLQHIYDPPPLPDFETRSLHPQLPPKLPFLTTVNLHAASATANGYASDGLTHGAAADPAEFYYRGLQTQQSPTGYTDSTTNGIDMATTDSRPPHSSLRSNGNGSTAKHPTIPARGVKNSYRSASSPLDDRMALSSAKSSPALNGMPRTGQSVKDLLKRFDQNNEQPSSTARKPSPRLTSKDGTSGPGYMRDRTGYGGRTTGNSPNTSSTSRAGNSTRDGLGRKSPEKSRTSQRTRFATEDQYSNNTLSGVPRSARPRNSVSGNSSQASKSMTNLSPTSPISHSNPSQTPARRPLFGEVLPTGPGSNDIGYGIPNAASRRTSESNLHPTWQRQRSRSEVDVSPSSPTAWYLGVTPALDDVDPNKSSRVLHGHNRNHSDFADTKANTMTGVNPAFESQSIPSLPTLPNSNPPPSRLPISTKRLSDSSASSSPTSTRANSPFATKSHVNGKLRKAEQRPYSPAVREPTKSSHTPSTQKSPRGKAHKAEPEPTGASLKAYISAPPPKTSPPLRSSRPRQPVSSASTNSSRQKAVDRAGSPQKVRTGVKVTRNEGPPGFDHHPRRKIIDTGPVDWQAHRDKVMNEKPKIMRVYTKSKNKEEQRQQREENWRRMQERTARDSLEAAGKESNVNINRPETPPVPALEPHLNLQNSPPPIRTSAQPLQVTTSFFKDDSPLERAKVPFEDSPTLGMPGTFIVDDEEPPSAISTASATTEIENEPQTEAARLRRFPSAKRKEPSRLSSNVITWGDELSPEQALYGISQDQESINVVLDASTLDRGEPTPTKDASHQDPSPPGAFQEDTDPQPVFATTLTSASPDRRSPALSRPATTFESGDEQGFSNAEHEPEPTISVQTPHHESQNPPEISFSGEAEYASAPNSSDGPRLQLPDVRTALAPPSVASNEAGSDFLNTPVTDMDYDSYDGAGTTNHDEQETYPASYEITRNPVPSSRSYRSSHRSSWTDYSFDSAREYSESEGGPKRLSVNISSTGQSSASLELSQSATPPVPAKPDGYSPLPSPRYSVSSPQISSPGRPQLPPLSGSEGFGFGFAEQTLNSVPLWPDHSPSPSQDQLTEAIPAPPSRSPPLPNLQGKRPSSSFGQSSHNDASQHLESRRPSDDLYSPRPSVSTPRSSTQVSIEDSLANDLKATITQTDADREASDALVKRLNKRKREIQELVNTEALYLKDMNVVEEIYKGTAEACPRLEPSDIKTIFRNTDEIVAFETAFLDDLRSSVATILPPRVSKSRAGKAGNGGSPTTTASDRFSIATTLNNDLSDEQKDRRTSVGACFGRNMKNIQKVYTSFLKSQESASARLAELQTDPSVNVWLNECDTVAKDLTHAWNIDSLLVKPFQRLTRYNMMLGDILRDTQEDHPDYEALSLACQEVAGLLQHINDMKARLERVGEIVKPRKRKESNVRLNVTKFLHQKNAKKEKDEAANGLSSSRGEDDPEYLKLHEKYNDNYLRMQVVLRDVEFHLRQCVTFVNDDLRYKSAMELVMRLSASPWPEIESKWARFNMSMRDMGTVALDQHTGAIRTQVIEPFEKMIQLYGPPGFAMRKRAKRRADYEKIILAKKSGSKINEKDQAKLDQYEALNETLKLELPQLFEKTEEIGNLLLGHFVVIQARWYDVWQKKVKVVLEESQIPKEIADIVPAFNRDYKYVEEEAQKLGIINGSVFADKNVMEGRLSDMSDGKIKKDGESKKPRPSDLTSRSRGQSVTSDKSPSLPTPDFVKRNSGSQFTFSPITSSNPSIPHFAYHPQSYQNQPYSTGHSRAGSGSPATPDPQMYRQNMGRPSTSRSYTSESAVRMSNDSNAHNRRESGSTYNSASHHMDGPPVSSRPYSGVFHSAMPLADGPEDSARSSRASSRDRNTSGGYNILYLAASLFEFNIAATKSEAGYPYLTYQAGEIFDVIGEKGELWLAKNQDDPSDQVGWIWSKHFARLASD